MAPSGTLEDRLIAGDSDPQSTPEISFVQKINMPLVNANGDVDLSGMPWSPTSELFHALVFIRERMHRPRRASSPLETRETEPVSAATELAQREQLRAGGIFAS